MIYSLRSKIDGSNFLEELIKNRGIENVEDFLHITKEYEESPYHLENLEKALENFDYHLKNNHKIEVIVDDDADGFLSSSIVYLFLKEINYPKEKQNFIFHDNKFHGIVTKDVSKDCDLLICPDSASSDYFQHNEITQNGTDILILDHHELTAGWQENDKVFLINNQYSQLYNNKYLCGTGVTFKFIKAYCEKYHLEINVDKWLDLVAIAIIGDVMNISSMENRYYVKTGLENINNPLFISMIDKKSYFIKETPSPTDISFYIVPSLNAVIRIGTPNEKRVLFTAIVDGYNTTLSTKRGHTEGETETYIEQALRICDNSVSKQKRKRVKAVEILKNNINAENQNSKIVIGKFYDDDELDTNLTGLTAMELASEYQKPALVLHFNAEKGLWTGSGRNFGKAIPDFKRFLNDSGLFAELAGHDNAFGAFITEENIPKVLEYADEKLKGKDFLKDNKYVVDYICNSTDMFLPSIIKSIDENKDIWGRGVEEPLLCIEDIPIYRSDIIEMGTSQDSYKFINNNISYIKFKDLEFFDTIAMTEEPMLVTVIGKANVNEWAGRKTCQIFIEDYVIKNYDF